MRGFFLRLSATPLPFQIRRTVLLADAINPGFKQKLLKTYPPHLRFYGYYDWNQPVKGRRSV